MIATLLVLGAVLFRESLVASAESAPLEKHLVAVQDEKPINGWVVCKDLGIGPVPGLSGNKQRVRLCHAQGWKVDTYCLRPDLPVPLIGGSCVRTGADTYWCGNGLQPLKEYRIQQVPTPTPTLTTTSTFIPTATSTQVPTAPTQPTVIRYPTEYPTPRPKPGGLGYRQLFSYAWNLLRSKPAVGQVQNSTPTPFRPLHPTLAFTPEIQPPPPALETVKESKIPGIELTAGKNPLSLRIKPDTKKINAGKNIKITFNLGADCEYGDGNACVNAYMDTLGAEITVLTVHSGLGGEAQELRQALEGTGFDQAGVTLQEVRRNLQNLVDSSVKISRGAQGEADLRVIAAVRLPARQVRTYIELPVTEILAYAAQQNPELLPYVHPDEPLILLETCGWRMPGENLPPGLPDTSASIYLLVMGQAR